MGNDEQEVAREHESKPYGSHGRKPPALSPFLLASHYLPVH